MRQPADTALAAYVSERYTALHRTAYLLTGDHTAVQDLAQTVLMRVCERGLRGQDVANLDAYLYRTMVNTQISGWRRKWRAERPSAVLPDRTAPDPLDRYDDRDELDRLLQRLPARQRAALVLRFYQDLSEADTAAALGCRPGTAKSLTSRGLARLRELSAAPGGSAETPRIRGDVEPC